MGDTTNEWDDERRRTRWIDGAYRDVMVPWSETRSGRALTLEQLRAAQLMAELALDTERVEKIMGLERGQIDTWGEDGNFTRVVLGVYTEMHPGEDEEFDFSKVLKPKQLEAAHLYFEEALTQVEVARRLHITDRTLRNWLTDPAFERFGHQLRKTRDRVLSQELEGHEKQLHQQLAQQRRIAMNVVAESLEQKDLKTAIEVLRPYLRSS